MDGILAGQPAGATSEGIFRAAERSGALPAELDAELLSERYPVFRALVAVSNSRAGRPGPR